MSTEGIEAYIRSCKKTVEPYIDDYLTRLAEERKKIDTKLAELYNTFREAGIGGKCVRGSLVKLGYELALGRTGGEEIIPACAAFEIFQTAILGHDDVIDKSPLRRGRDSIWRALSKGGRELHYGVSQAICLGDAGIFLANRLIAAGSFDPLRKAEAMRTFLDVQLNTVDGEMLDVFMSCEKNYGDEEGVLNIAALKTAWYTIIGPLQLGAILGGASPKLLEAARKYGMSLGIAFQLKDDILGIDAATSDTGKSNTSDVSEGKVTLLAHVAMKNAKRDQLARLSNIYGKEDASEADRLAVRDIFENTGAFAEVERRLKSYLTEAKSVIGGMTQNIDQAALLTQLADMMALRKS